MALLLVGSGFLAGVGAEQAGNGSGDSWFADHTAESFASQAAAQQAIAPQRIDADLLDAAVFHETGPLKPWLHRWYGRRRASN